MRRQHLITNQTFLGLIVGLSLFIAGCVTGGGNEGDAPQGTTSPADDVPAVDVAAADAVAPETDSATPDFCR